TVLLLSSMGYQPMELRIEEGKYVYTIQLLEEPKALSQVVVTGYQTINKESYTGTAVTKSGEEVRQVNAQNVRQAMQVFDPSFKIMDINLAGGNPNALPTSNVRGSSSLPTGGNEVLRRDNINSMVNMPAFILDGFEVSVQ